MHEAGHAVLAASFGREVERVTIVRRGTGLGHAALAREDRQVLKRSELLERIAIALSGKVAEELVWGEASTGAEADIEAATGIARDMAGRWGMSEGIGPVRITASDAEVFLGRDLTAMQSVSPETLDKLDVEIRMLVEEGQRIAQDRLHERRAQLDLLADELEAVETLDGEHLQRLLATGQPTPTTVEAKPRRARRTTEA